MSNVFLQVTGSKGDLLDFPRRLNKAVNETFGVIINPLLDRTVHIARKKLAIGSGIGFEGDLLDSVKRYKFNGARDGKVYIKNKKIQGSRDTTLSSAFQNEFGTKPYIMKFAGNPKLKRWVTSKGLSLSKGSLLIGGKNSRVKLGQSLNMFWTPTFVQIEREINTIVSTILKEKLVIK